MMGDEVQNHVSNHGKHSVNGVLAELFSDVIREGDRRLRFDVRRHKTVEMWFIFYADYSNPWI